MVGGEWDRNQNSCHINPDHKRSAEDFPMSTMQGPVSRSKLGNS